MIAKVIGRNGLILATFAAICVGLIAFTFYITKDTIASEMKGALARTLNELVDKSLYDNDVYADCSLIADSALLGSDTPLQAYRMRKSGKPVAVVLESIAPNGYSGKIVMVVGIYANGSLAGVRVTSHNETPGLGDKIDVKKSDWIFDFDNKSLSNPDAASWKVKKDGGDFDAITGATITPRAVVNQVAQTLAYFQQNKQLLFASQQNCHSNIILQRNNDNE